MMQNWKSVEVGFDEFCKLLGGEPLREGVASKCFIRRGPKSGTTFEYYPDSGKLLVKSFSKVPFHRYGGAEWVKEYRTDGKFSCEVGGLMLSTDMVYGYVVCKTDGLRVRVTVNEYPDHYEGTMYIDSNRFSLSDVTTMRKILTHVL